MRTPVFLCKPKPAKGAKLKKALCFHGLLRVQFLTPPWARFSFNKTESHPAEPPDAVTSVAAESAAGAPTDAVLPVRREGVAYTVTLGMPVDTRVLIEVER